LWPLALFSSALAGISQVCIAVLECRQPQASRNDVAIATQE
jgi:hypothetical protein